MARLDNGQIRIIPRFFNHSESSTARLLGLKSGGGANLRIFAEQYLKHIGQFAGRPIHPVIVLCDNDSGGGPIRNYVREKTRRQFTNEIPFIHVRRNLYVIVTPGENSKIEDLFEDEIKAVRLNGKSFNPENNADSESHYGKARFAEFVVEPNANRIDFSRFRPLLARLTSAVQDYRTKIDVAR